MNRCIVCNQIIFAVTIFYATLAESGISHVICYSE